MVEAIAGPLRQYPELAVFLVLAVGYWIGNVRFGSFALGAVTGSLFAGLLIGQLDIPVSGPAKSVLFMLFLFANGYTVGPQFFRALKGDGVRSLALTLVQCICGLVVCVLFARLLKLDPGMAAGLLSGSLTQSPAIGAAAETIQKLPLDQMERDRLVAHVVVADALTYVFGTSGAILFLSRVAPRLLGVDLRQEAALLEAKMGIDSKRSGMLSAYRPLTARAYRVDDPALHGHPVAELEIQSGPQRVSVTRLRRGDTIIQAMPQTMIETGDVVVLSGRRLAVMNTGARVGEEVEDQQLLTFPVALVSIIASGVVDGKSLRELTDAPSLDLRNVYLRRVVRLGQEIPILPETVLQQGDVLDLVGGEADLERVAKHVGRILKPSSATDIGAVGIAIVVGGLLGIPSAVLGDLHIGLGTSVGALLGGVVVGWLSPRIAGFGQAPRAAIDFMRDIGLAAFLGINGLQAGPHFVAAFQEFGGVVLLAGAVCTLFPLLVSIFFGVRVLRMNPVLVLGACAGAQTSTPSLAAVQESSGSPVAILGYTVPYAVSQVILTIWGSVIVGVMT